MSPLVAGIFSSSQIGINDDDDGDDDAKDQDHNAIYHLSVSLSSNVYKLSYYDNLEQKSSTYLARSSASNLWIKC